MSVLVPPAHLLGSDVGVPCADGIDRRYVNLDYAASTPVMAAVWDAVEAFVPWYSSVHRGTGREVADLDRGLRAARARSSPRFVGAPDGTTSSSSATPPRPINVLATRAAAGHARALHAGRAPREHAPVAPPRPAPAAVPAPRPTQLLEVTARRRCSDAPHRPARRHRRLQRHRRGVAARASSPTLAHEHGAQLFVDAAQLAPHRAIDMAALGIDHLALSGHKLYAPFGAGALVSRTPLTGDPLMHGRRRDQARHRSTT